MRLIDRVSGPAGRIQQSLGALNTATRTISGALTAPQRAVTSTARRLRRDTQNMTAATGMMSIGLGLAAKSIYDYEDKLNEIEGRRFGKRDIFQLADGTEMSRQAFRKSVISLIEEINATVPRSANEIAAAYNQLVQAGMGHEQVEAILPTAIEFAIAGNYDTEEAADKLTNVMTAMQMPMALYEDAVGSAKRASDVIAFSANRTNSSVHQMTEAFKFSAPSAAALGLSVEQLAGMFEIMARRGIKGSEAGVAVRSMLTRMVRPTKMAQGVLANYNLDLADYIERVEELTAQDILNPLLVGGLDAGAARGGIDAILQREISSAEKVQQITRLISETMGDLSTMSAQSISDVVSEALFAGGEQLDVERLIQDMEAAGIATADFFRIFDVRQGSRTLALFSESLADVVKGIEGGSEGFTRALKETRMQGIVGAVSRLSAAFVQLFRAMADAGVLDAVTTQVSSLADATTRLAEINPRLLEFGTYALATVAAIGPLGLALSGFGYALAFALNPLTVAAGALATMVALNFDAIESFMGAFSTIFMANLTPESAKVVSGIGDTFSRLTKGIKGFFDIDPSGEGWARTAKDLGEGMASIVNRVQPALGPMGDFARNVGEIVRNFASAQFDRIKRFGEVLGRLGAKMSEAGVLGAVGELARGLGSIVSNIASLGANIVGAVGESIIAFFDGFVSTMSPGAMQAVAGGLRAAGDLAGALADAFGQISVDTEAFVNSARGIGEAIGAGVSTAIEAIHQLIGAIQSAAEALRSLVLPGVSPVVPEGGFSQGAAGRRERRAAPRVEGKRARGGPVERGLTYLVGEEGPELFTPGRSGGITPNGALGGTAINNTFHITGGNAKEIAREIAQTLDRQLRRSRQTAIDGRQVYRQRS